MTSLAVTALWKVLRLMRPAEGAHVVAMARTEREASEEETAEPGESAVEITEE